MRLLLALAAALSLTACGEPAHVWPPASPPLWEVTGRNGEQAWLLGTIHALPDGVEWHTDAIDRAFASSDMLMVEIGNLGDTEEARQDFTKLSVSTPQPPLTLRVSKDDRPALEALMKRASLTNEDFWNVETWAAALMLSNAARATEPANGVDRALLKLGKPVRALESYTAQFARFDSLPESDQRALLAGVVREAGTDRDRDNVTAWLTGDLDALERQMNREFLGTPGLSGPLLIDRNHYFAGAINVALVQRHKPFVAVGAGHMLGPDGLPALLAARGYTVRRLP
ncbi:MAG: TraB/GumN family protein [Croceibacterium sp.]